MNTHNSIQWSPLLFSNASITFQLIVMPIQLIVITLGMDIIHTTLKNYKAYIFKKLQQHHQHLILSIIHMMRICFNNYNGIIKI